MKLTADAKVIVKNASTLQGGEGRPLSELAAQNDEQLATNFPLEPRDKELAKRVLAKLGDLNGQLPPDVPVK